MKQSKKVTRNQRDFLIKHKVLDCELDLYRFIREDKNVIIFLRGSEEVSFIKTI